MRRFRNDHFLASELEEKFFHSLGSILHSPIATKFFELTRFFYSDSRSDWVDTTEIFLELPRLPVSFHGYRLVQISDLHIGTWLTEEKLEDAVKLINQLRPDLIAITGDFVTYHPAKYSHRISRILAELEANDGKLAVLGNHDHWTDATIIRTALQAAGINELNNDVHSIQRGRERLYIAGIDDHYVGKDRLELVYDQIPPESASILMAHEPDFADISAKSGVFDLQMSGHSHGGQIILPGWGALYLPFHGRKYPSGLYQVQDMYLYTNRGLGTAELQIRHNCRPEITLYQLQALS